MDQRIRWWHLCSFKYSKRVSATVNSSKMMVSLDEDFAGIGYITFTLTDKDGGSFRRKIGVTQQLAAPINSSSSSTPQFFF